MSLSCAVVSPVASPSSHDQQATNTCRNAPHEGKHEQNVHRRLADLRAQGQRGAHIRKSGI